MFVRVFLCTLLIGFAGVACAQSEPATAQQRSATRQPTPEQRAAIRKQDEVLVNSADRVVAMIDHGQAGQVWDQASDVAKKSVSRSQFVAATRSERARLGALKSRKLSIVTRTLSNGGGQLPPGQYVNVNFATRFGNQAKPIRELVSFHLDGDHKWRLSGYSVQQPESTPGT